MELTNEIVLKRLQDKFPDAIEGHNMAYDFMNVEFKAEMISEVLGFLKNDPKLNFMYLTDLCGVHMPAQTGKEIGVVYHLHNLEENYRFRLKAWVPESNPEIASATPFWLAANWMERETYDFYGVRFIGHPNLKRILNVDHMEIFPMLKQYPLEDTTREDKEDRFFGR